MSLQTHKFDDWFSLRAIKSKFAFSAPSSICISSFILVNGIFELEMVPNSLNMLIFLRLVCVIWNINPNFGRKMSGKKNTLYFSSWVYYQRDIARVRFSGDNFVDIAFLLATKVCYGYGRWMGGGGEVFRPNTWTFDLLNGRNLWMVLKMID